MSDAPRIIRAAVIALAVGLCVNVYGITADNTALAAIGMAVIFVALAV